jgi:hypothetical protein
MNQIVGSLIEPKQASRRLEGGRLKRHWHPLSVIYMHNFRREASEEAFIGFFPILVRDFKPNTRLTQWHIWNLTDALRRKSFAQGFLVHANGSS